jgi:hypothetical protein
MRTVQDHRIVFGPLKLYVLANLLLMAEELPYEVLEEIAGRWDGHVLQMANRFALRDKREISRSGKVAGTGHTTDFKSLERLH